MKQKLVQEAFKRMSDQYSSLSGGTNADGKIADELMLKAENVVNLLLEAVSIQNRLLEIKHLLTNSDSMDAILNQSDGMDFDDLLGALGLEKGFEMVALSAYEAFVKSGLKSAEGVQLVELEGKRLAYLFSEKGFSNGEEMVAVDLYGNALEDFDKSKICILMSGRGFM
jgi:hypothetical protein